MTSERNTTEQNTTPETDHDPATVEANIRRFARRIRFRAGIIGGEGYSHGHGTSPSDGLRREPFAVDSSHG
jgi:hypothetical protein